MTASAACSMKERRLNMGLTRLTLKFAAPLPDLTSFERYLFVGPHPDDIEIGAGATASRLAAAGKQVCFLICTDGRFGDEAAPEGISRGELIALRRSEAIRSAAALGVSDVRFLSLSDGGLYAQDELLCAIAKVVGDFCPEVLFAPDPCVASECHRDHLNVGEAVRRIACMAPNGGAMLALGTRPAPVRALAFYMTARPNRYVATRGHFARQLHAIFDIHHSQFPPGCEQGKTIRLYLRLRALDFGLRSLKGCAEGFRVLGGVHMHCLPEAER